MEEVREYERTMQDKTNCKVKSSQNAGEAAAPAPLWSNTGDGEGTRGVELDAGAVALKTPQICSNYTWI